jgi:hypothetical protein
MMMVRLELDQIEKGFHPNYVSHKYTYSSLVVESDHSTVDAWGIS